MVRLEDRVRLIECLGAWAEAMLKYSLAVEQGIDQTIAAYQKAAHAKVRLDIEKDAYKNNFIDEYNFFKDPTIEKVMDEEDRIAEVWGEANKKAAEYYEPEQVEELKTYWGKLDASVRGKDFYDKAVEGALKKMKKQKEENNSL